MKTKSPKNIVYYLEKDGEQIGNFRKTISGITSHLYNTLVQGRISDPQYLLKLYRYQNTAKEVSIIKLDLLKKEFTNLGKPAIIKRYLKTYFIQSKRFSGCEYRVLGLYQGTPIVLSISILKVYNIDTRQYVPANKFSYAISSEESGTTIMELDLNYL